MAESRQGGETIREMLSGFNQMQSQLGLLPVSSGQMPMGVQLNQPPPPPPVLPPGDVAAQVSAQQQAMMMQTMQSAQMTRYQPPPSSPAQGGGGATWGGSFSQMGAAQFNPQIAAAMGGGGRGMPNPIYSTAPAYGMYRPGSTGPGMSPFPGMQAPPIYNPFAPQLPAPMFATQPQQNYQMMQARQSDTVGTLAAIGEAGYGLGGALAGGAIGTMLGGPIGGFAGGILGGMAGQAMGNMAMTAPLMDIQRGRGIQNMTSSFMAGGASLNPFTGMGMERGAAQQTATGLRKMGSSYDFQRQTGFNTEDVMKLTQLAGDQGLLQTAQNPEDILKKMQQVSKSLAALVKITGDPDVRNAVKHLGQMQQLGFEGIQGQTAAISNRARFAQMAGVSQGAMHEQYGMPGAFMAQNMGLAGATGYSAGMMGGATANMGVSSRSFTDVQLSLAGGKQGVGQTAAMAALGAINQDVFATAALRRGKDGKLTIDEDAYVSASKKSLSEVADLSAQSLGRLTDEERTSYAREAPEMKAKLAEQLGPQRLLMNAARQASALMKDVPNIGLGGALEVMTGGNKQASRTLQLMMENPDYWDTQIQQERVTQREGASRTRAALSGQLSGGLLTNIGRGVSGGLSDIGDAFSSPFVALAESGQRGDEDIAAAKEHTYLTRRTGSELLRTDADRSEAAAALSSDAFRGVGGGESLMKESFLSRAAGRLGALTDMSALDSANRMARIGNKIEGGFFAGATTIGDAEAAQAAALSAGSVAEMAKRGTGFTNEQAADAMRGIQTQLGRGAGDADEFIRSVQKEVQSQKGAGWGGLKTAGAVTREDLEKATAKIKEKMGITAEVDTSKVGEMVARRAVEEGEGEVYARSAIASIDASGVKATSSSEAIYKRADEIETKLGIEASNSEKDKEAVRLLASAHTPEAMALAAGAMQGDSEAAVKIREQVREKLKGTPGAYEKASQEAGEIRRGVGGSVSMRRLLTNVAKADGADKALDSFGLLRTEVKARGGAKSREETLLGIEADTGETTLTGTTREIAERLTTKMVKDEDTGEQVAAYTKIKDPTLRAAFDKFAKAADKDAATEELNPFLLSKGDKKVEIHGAETRGAKDMIAELEEAKKKFAKGKGTRGDADVMFANSVQLFYEAAKGLSNKTDKDNANAAELPGAPGAGKHWYSW